MYVVCGVGAYINFLARLTLQFGISQGTSMIRFQNIRLHPKTAGHIMKSISKRFTVAKIPNAAIGGEEKIVHLLPSLQTRNKPYSKG